MPNLPKWVAEAGGIVPVLRNLKKNISNNEGDLLQLGIDTITEYEAKIERLFEILQELSPWTESNDMDWLDELICGIGILSQKSTPYVDLEDFARRLHVSYEKAAYLLGWKTQDSCRDKQWEDLPKANRETMLAACEDVLQQLGFGLQKTRV